MQEQKLQDYLEWTDGTEVYEKELLDKTEGYDDIVIFGAGIGGRMTLELLEKRTKSGKVSAFSDNNTDKTGTVYMGRPVIRPEQIRKEHEKALILVSSTAFDIISDQLQKTGVKEKNIFYFQPAGISLEGQKADMTFIQENMQKFEWVYQRLADETSRRIYSNLLNYRISKNVKWLKMLKDVIWDEADQYFDKEILGNYDFDGGFVDAGAYTGDTVISFYKHYPDWKGTYYCLEAGEDTYRRLCKNIECLDNGKIVPFQYAVWDTEDTLMFDTETFGNGEGSRICVGGGRNERKEYYPGRAVMGSEYQFY